MIRRDQHADHQNTFCYNCFSLPPLSLSPSSHHHTLPSYGHYGDPTSLQSLHTPPHNNDNVGTQKITGNLRHQNLTVVPCIRNRCWVPGPPGRPPYGPKRPQRSIRLAPLPISTLPPVLTPHQRVPVFPKPKLPPKPRTTQRTLSVPPASSPVDKAAVCNRHRAHC